MRRWRAASSPSSTRRRCAGSAARCRAPACWREDAVAKALTALRRFRALCKIQQVGRVFAIATAACRDASNGPDFIAKAERICGAEIEILSGPREAKLSALGVVSGIHNPDGIVGDLGGGSLELIDVHGNRVRSGVTLPLGSLALQDLSDKSLKRAERIVSSESVRRGPAQGRPGPHLLRGRRHLARAGAHPHRPERLSAAGDARLLDCRPPTRSISRGACAGWRPPTCSPISKSSPMRGVRC